MKKILLILTLLISINGFSQSQTNEDYYYETYLYDQYKREKEHIMLSIVGSFGMGFMSGRDYYYSKDNLSLTTSCFSFGISTYSIYKLIKLNKEIKKWERSKSKKETE
jgi:hypothetical protein